MKNLSWSPEDCAEYDALVEEVFDRSRLIDVRTRDYLAGIADGVQGNRRWARDAMREIEWTGAQALVKREEATVRSHVKAKGRNVPGTVGVRRQRADGDTEQLRLGWEELTRDGIRAKRDEYAKQRDAANVNVAICAALDDLMEAHPMAATVADALIASGEDLQSYLNAYFAEQAA